MKDRDGNAIGVGSRVLIVTQENSCYGHMGGIGKVAGHPTTVFVSDAPYAECKVFMGWFAPSSLALVSEDVLGDAAAGSEAT